MERTLKVNNSFYGELGERWYKAYDDPIALLRAENKAMFPWIINKIRQFCDHNSTILDVGCGAGFLSNELARQGYQVTGVDIEGDVLDVARNHDSTNTVKYETADAYKLPYEDGSFDIVTAMDFLEHVERPKEVIAEFSRVLKPGGLFFFHTFNRNFLAHVVVIKLIEWFVKNTPKNMHVINLFIKPEEMKKYCRDVSLEVIGMIGVMPKISTIDWKMIRTGVISRNMEFTLTKSTRVTYLGVARKA
jgi:2-polyprenyl-6-hydroxyphenyl methylase / 3-demethylubiquinone-9 3-methyltransferase